MSASVDPTPQHSQTCLRDFEPDDFDLYRDICAVSMWLTQKFKVDFVHLFIDKHPFHKRNQLARCTVMQWHLHLDELTEASQTAFSALGYRIKDTGEDLTHCNCCDGEHSQHETLHAFLRIEAAIQKHQKSR